MAKYNQPDPRNKTAGTEAMQVRMAYITALLDHFGARSFKYEKEKAVVESVRDDSIARFNATD